LLNEINSTVRAFCGTSFVLCQPMGKSNPIYLSLVLLPSHQMQGVLVLPDSANAKTYQLWLWTKSSSLRSVARECCYCEVPFSCNNNSTPIAYSCSQALKHGLSSCIPSYPPCYSHVKNSSKAKYKKNAPKEQNKELVTLCKKIK
jgi:hypothetical protein